MFFSFLYLIQAKNTTINELGLFIICLFTFWLVILSLHFKKGVYLALLYDFLKEYRKEWLTVEEIYVNIGKCHYFALQDLTEEELISLLRKLAELKQVAVTYPTKKSRQTKYRYMPPQNACLNQ